MEFIELSRRFHDLTKSELEDPDRLAALAESSILKADGWPELLQHPRVLILAEAGTGKTAEMREQVRRLQTDGKPAFFIPLELLSREQLTDLLSAAEEHAFHTWKASEQSIAWFFLDAADELKLTAGKLEQALGRLAKATDGLLHRVRVVISCRPSDWRPSSDLATVQARLPIAPSEPASRPAADEIFIGALREQIHGRTVQATEAVKVDGPRAVVLLPMSNRQIEAFARGLGVSDTTAFIDELGRRDAWAFARRPLDLSELVQFWTTHRRLGTRAEQHELNVTVKLRDDPDRPDRGVLAETRARLGAERLALALALTHTLTIRSPDQPLDVERAEGVLDPSAILTDWTEEEQQALLRRALFDPATYGRVRFHHRSVQEYLAARRLDALRRAGMRIKSLLRLIFAERYGVPVVVPSMRPVAAWLALWNEDVRRELMLREPETLLSMGDPETLPISARAGLVRAFADAYGRGGWRGFRIPVDEIRRLSGPELAGVVRDRWGQGPPNEEVRDLLLTMVWQGAIGGCADIVEAAAYNVDLPEHQRAIAVRALLACGRLQTVREIAQSIVNDRGRWPDGTVHNLAGELFPAFLSPVELITLVETTHEAKNAVGGFSWVMHRIADAVEPWAPTSVQLRDLLADLIWRGRHEKQEPFCAMGSFNYVAPALAVLCGREFSTDPSNHHPGLVRASVIACRFGDDEIGARETVEQLRRRFADDVRLRELGFWSDLSVVDVLAPEQDSAHRLYSAETDGVVGQLGERDQPWLESALRDNTEPSRRPIALLALARLWTSRGRVEAELGVLQEATNDDDAMTERLRAWAAPPEPDARLEEMQRTRQRRRSERDAQERLRLEDWTKWHRDLVADPDAAFTPDHRPSTIPNLYKWLSASHRQSNHFNVWDREALARAFGDDVATRAQAAFQGMWRDERPAQWSLRPPEERNSVPETWILGLCGISAEAESPEWAKRLSHDEAQVAAGYSTVEINGLPVWLKDLTAVHPAAVDAVLGDELEAELEAGTEHGYLPVLQDLASGDLGLKRLLAPRALRRLASWPSLFTTEEASGHSSRHLDHVLRILDEAVEGQDRVVVARECEKRIASDPTGPLAMVWLRGLFRIDPNLAAKALEDGIAAVGEPERANHAVSTLAGLFGNHDAILADFTDVATRAAVLGRLVRCAYDFVRREDDREHEGVYSPDTRDRAQTARNVLLSALLDTPGPEARRVLLDLAADPRFAQGADRLRYLTRERAAKDSESEPLTPTDVVLLEERYEAPPHTRDGLFDVMIDRLDDLAHNLAHDDFTDRRTLRTIQDEVEMQRTLAGRLRGMARGAYVVTREEEVADLKRTDIRLAAVRGEVKAAIEIKIADRWSLTELERALRNQLVGRYLRHDTCRVGCLLLSFHGTKTYWEHPEEGTRLSFTQVIAHLADRAREIENEMANSVRLAVVGLDLTDPVFAPTHG
jgi:hypothetical protein